MKTINKFLQWGSSHHPQWLVFIRVLLGLLLFAKGIDFIQDLAGLRSLLQFNGVDDRYTLMSVAIAGLHLIGGVFIIQGLFTRLIVLIQLPVICGALWIDKSGAELTYAASVLILLLLFLFVGGGRVSLDHYFFGRQEDVQPV